MNKDHEAEESLSRMKMDTVRFLGLAIVGRGEGAPCQGNGEMLGSFGLGGRATAGKEVSLGWGTSMKL